MQPVRRGGWVWVRWLAVLALLVHAGLVVRHNAHVLWAASVSQDVAASVICSSDPASARDLASDQGQLPAATAPCPICSLAASASLPPPAVIAFAFAPLTGEPTNRLADQVADARTSEAPPPNRGPPLPT